MVEYNTDALLEAFDHSYDADPSDAILKAMTFIRDNTGLLGDYNDGKAVLNVGGTTLMVTSRSTTFSRHSPLLSWVQDQDDLYISLISTKSMSGGETRPHVEIKEA